MTDRAEQVVVVGAGLAGLACAQLLSRSGMPVLVLEASDGVGGRVRTDVVDGYRCDRGFQLLNPAYPVLRRVLDPADLDLRPFRGGVVVATGEQRFVLADPRREPQLLAATLRAPVGSLPAKLAFAAWAARSLLPVRTQRARPDRSRRVDLHRAGVRGALRNGVVEPFLSGVLAEDDGSTSALLTALLVRSFVLGSPGVPSLGMGRLPELIAAALPAGSVRLGTPVSSVTPTSARTADEVIPARAVVVATDPVGAAELTGQPATPMKALTTFWHSSAVPPSRERFLHLDADRRGPIVNTVVMTSAAPSYAPAGRSLVATTVLGADGSAAAEAVVRRQAGLIYGADTAGWELVQTSVVTAALPSQPPPLQVRQPVALSNGLFVAGDHRDTASIQGALVSGRRAAVAVLRAQ